MLMIMLKIITIVSLNHLKLNYFKFQKQVILKYIVNYISHGDSTNIRSQSYNTMVVSFIHCFPEA